MEAELTNIDQPGVDQQYKIDKKTLNHIRTTSRNNIERIKIADQKASVLMSLNADCNCYNLYNYAVFSS